MEFDKNKYRVYDRKHFMMLHWMLNPGLAFNEIILGQRIPKVMLEDKTSDKPRFERTFIPCPHCSTLHDSRTWSAQNNTAFKNWFGLYCPLCSGIIPCLSNFTSFLILTVTFPIWGWFRKSLKNKWIEKQPERYSHIRTDIEPNPFARKGWVRHGIAFGAIMFLIMEVATPLVLDEEITGFKLAVGIPVWLIAGLGWGYFMKVFSGKRGNSFISEKP